MKRRDSSVVRTLEPETHATRLGATFWDEVEREIEALDVNDFEEFLEADQGPHEARAEFREGLRQALSRFVRRRYGQ